MILSKLEMISRDDDDEDDPVWGRRDLVANA
jgi:hypothetical protein